MKRIILSIFLLFSILFYSCNDTKTVKVFILAGQSNMEGPGQTKYLEENNMDNLLKKRDDVWCVYAGRVSGPLKPEYGFRRNNFGPELLMGHTLGDSIDNDIILFKSAIGGTTLHVDWRPPSAVKRAGGEVGPLYNDMIRRFHTMIRNLDTVLPGRKVKKYEIAGFVWLQGESDCCEKTEEGIGYQDFYKDNLDDFVADVRKDIGIPELPFIIVQINNGVWDGKSCGGGPLVREIERAKAESEENISLVVTMDLNDGYHYDSPSHIIIGERIGRAAILIAKNTVNNNYRAIEKAGNEFLQRNSQKNIIPCPDMLEKDLIGYWKFDTGEGEVIYDLSSAENEGIIIGQTGREWIKGKFGDAIKLQGDNYIEIPGFKEPLGDMGTIENLSVSFWIQTPGKVGSNRIGKGVGHKTNYNDDTDWFISEQANDCGWDIGNYNYDGFPHFTASFDSAGAQTAYISWGEPPLDGDGFEWHHVVAVYDGTIRNMKIYCDNYLAKEELKELGGSGIIPADVALKIGGDLIQDNNFQSFDELAIWSRPLSKSEINALYNNGLGTELHIDN